jgi:hypothetical protein
MPSFAEAHNALQTVKSFFYVHNIDRHDEENILNKEKVKQLQIKFGRWGLWNN